MQEETKQSYETGPMSLDIEGEHILFFQRLASKYNRHGWPVAHFVGNGLPPDVVAEARCTSDDLGDPRAWRVTFRPITDEEHADIAKLGARYAIGAPLPTGTSEWIVRGFTKRARGWDYSIFKAGTNPREA